MFDKMSEQHKIRTTRINGSAKELIGLIAELLFDKSVRYIKIELDSEGTLYWMGKLSKRY